MSEASEFLFNYVISIPDCYKKFSFNNPIGPGQVVLKMSDEKRNLLKTLKSEDMSNIREDAIFGTPKDWKNWGLVLPKRKGRWGL